MPNKKKFKYFYVKSLILESKLSEWSQSIHKYVALFSFKIICFNKN